MWIKFLVVLHLIFACALSVPLLQQNEDRNIEAVFNNENEIMRKTPNFIVKCSTSTKDIFSFLTCTAEETLSIIRKVSKLRSLELLPGMVVTSNEVSTENSRKLFSADLPINPAEKLTKLLETIYDATSEFISGRTIKIQFPDVPSGISGEEGRGKKKKIRQVFSLIMKILALKLMTYGPAMAVVGAIAIKALLAAKLAFILATVLGLQSLVGNSPGGIASLFKGNSGNSNHGSSSHSEGWSSQPEENSGWERSFNNNRAHSTVTAHDLAYAGQKPL